MSTIDPELLLAKRRELELLQQKQKLIKSFGLSFYRPHPRQDRFHRKGDKKHRLWEAGNRGGKSTGGVAETSSFLLGHRPFYPVGDPARTLGIPQHPVKGLVITTDWDKVDEIFTSQRGEEGKLWKFLPRGFAKSTKRNHSGAIETVECENGSILRFDTVKSWMSNPQGIESSDHDFIHIDEPCPKKMYEGASRGLMDRNGKDWFTLTPLTEPWIHNMFFPSRKSKERVFESEFKWAQRTSTLDNPYLSVESIEDFRSSLKRDDIECRIDGIPLQLSGLVFKEFDYDRHVLSSPLEGWRAYDKPPASWTVYVAIDPHPQTPHHVLFMAVGPYDTCVLYDEIFLHCPIPDLGNLILSRTAGSFVAQTILDPYGFQQHPNLNVASYDEDLASVGVFVSKASKDRAGGIMRVKQALIEPNRLFVSPHLEETLYEFSNHAWDERENKPKDEDDHAMENLGRLFLEGPRLIDQTTNDSAPVSQVELYDLDLSLPDLHLD